MGKKKKSRKTEYLKRLYTTPTRPGSLQGVEKLLKTTLSEKKFKFNRKQLTKWLTGEEAYTVHRRPRRTFTRIPVIVRGLKDQYDADLMDLRRISKYNKGYKYVLIMIDVFSRYVWAQPMKRKKEKNAIEVFKKIFETAPLPLRLRTDKGGEFTGGLIKKFFREQKIQHFVTWNEIKANYAERVIQTLKKKIFRYLTLKRTRTYINVLQDIIKGYNKTFHSSINCSPSEVNENNEKNIWWNIYMNVNMKSKKYKPFKYQVGNTVRISSKRGRLDREYDEKWSNEIFRITRRFYKKGIKQYKVEDYSGKAKEGGSFYEAEIQPVSVDDKTLWRVDTILKTRGKGPDKEHFVHWFGWPKKYDQWIPASHLV